MLVSGDVAVVDRDHHGALGERIRTHGAGWTFDPLDPGTTVTLFDRLTLLLK